MTLSFTKMQGLGNDFVVLQASQLEDGADLPALAQRLCDRHFGIGADGLIVVSPPSDPSLYDIRFVYLNGDGSWAEMCGNGIRCFARYVNEHGLLPGRPDTFRVETGAGLIQPVLRPTLPARVANPDAWVSVNMGPPRLRPEDFPYAGGCPPSGEPAWVHDCPVDVLGQTVRVNLVSMGNPHCILFQDAASPLDPAVFGPALEAHPHFPAKSNIEFVRVLDPQTVDLTVWERGCGLTLACGTGACATAVASHLAGHTGSEVAVQLPGGTLLIRWDRNGDGSVWMSGPAETVFTGELIVKLT